MLRRLVLASSLLALALLLAWRAEIGARPAAALLQLPRNHAGIVVQYGDGRVASRCVGFDEDSLSGLELLQRAGFGVIAQGYAGAGGLVCKIDDVGCSYPQESCTCKCQGADCVYWSYFHMLNGAWHYSAVGAGSYAVRHGAVEGWSWGPGGSGRGSSPPVLSFEQVCPVVAAVPSPLPPTPAPPSATPLPPTPAPPSATARPAPSSTQPPARPAATVAATRRPAGAGATSPPATTAATLAALAPRASAGPAPSATSPAPRPAASPQPSATLVAALQPEPTAPQQAAGSLERQQGTGSTAGYIAFGAIVGGLAIAALILARQRAG